MELRRVLFRSEPDEARHHASVAEVLGQLRRIENGDGRIIENCHGRIVENRGLSVSRNRHGRLVETGDRRAGQGRDQLLTEVAPLRGGTRESMKEVKTRDPGGGAKRVDWIDSPFEDGP